MKKHRRFCLLFLFGLVSGAAMAQTGQIQLDVSRVYDINGDIDAFFVQADYYCIAKVAACNGI